MNTKPESTVSEPATPSPRHSALRAGAVTVVSLLILGAGVGHARWYRDARTAPAGRAALAAPAASAVSLPPAGAAAVPEANAADDWTQFQETIHQPAAKLDGSVLPPYEQFLGVTIEADASGIPVVKWLVLDRGDLSVHAVDPVTP